MATRAMFLVAIACCLVGCSETKKGLVPVQGRMTLHDKPVVYYIVTFRPTGQTEGSGSIGGIDEEGHFELSDVRAVGKGAFPGKYTVHLYPAPSGASGKVPDHILAAVKNQKIPSIYLNPTASPLIVEVPSDGCFMEIQLAEDVADTKVTTKPLTD